MLAALVTQGLTEEGSIPANLFEESDVADRVEHHLRELGTGIDDRLYNRGGLPEGEYASGLDEFLHGMTNPMSAHYSESEERAGLVDRPGPQGAAVSASIGEREEKEAAVRKIAAAKEQSRAEAAAQDDWVRSVGYEPDQDLSNPEKGILVGEIPADKLLRIRKQAAERAPGYTGGEGSFSQQEMTPEIAAREAELKRWLAGQDERNAQFSLTPEQSRRDPAAAQLASQRLVELKRNKQLEARQASVDAIVAKMGGEGGKVPFEQAQQLQMLGVNVPYGSVGTSKEDGVGFFDSAVGEAGKALSSVSPLDAIGNPALEGRMKFEQYGAMLAEDYKRKVAAGMNPDDAISEFKQKMAQLALASGLVNMQEIGQQTQQMQQPQASQ